MTKQNVRIKVHFREAFSGAPLPILDPPEARFLNLPTNKPIAPGKAKYFPNDSTSVYEFSDISENTVIRMDVSGQLAKGGKSEFSTASCVLRLDVPEGSHILRDIYLLCLAPANADLSEVKFCLDPSSLTADPSASRQGITIRVTNTSYKRSHTDPGSVWYVPYFHDFPLGEDGTVSVSLPVGDCKPIGL